MYLAHAGHDHLAEIPDSSGPLAIVAAIFLIAALVMVSKVVYDVVKKRK